MEIVFEILLEALKALIEAVGEVVLQTVVEIFGEVVGHGMRETFRRPKPLDPWLAAIGYLAWGAIAGGLSLWAFRDHFITARWLRIANLIITPIFAGLLMAKLGAWRRRHDQETIRLDSFAYAFCFAFGMAVVRFIWAK